ncbi:universal stress protein [Kitasatospora cinereorecta]|uniref:Universal stress protein n=1 Tax=Kitasatospora cinereorecta TaxID=285560 RepID=A0ABW0V2L7_9ACTN
MAGPITVGFDGSPQSLAAARWAAREAELRGARLELVQAWPWAAPHLLAADDAVAEGRRWLNHAETELRAMLPEVEVTGTQIPATAVDTLLEASGRASMVVLGSRGLGMLRGFLVGSVSQHVLARASCPVVLVRAPDEAADRTADGTANRTADEPAERTAEVVLGLDLDRPGDEVLGFAFEAAALRGMPLRVIHCWRPPTGDEYRSFTAIAGMDEELTAGEQQRLADAIAPWRAKYPDLEVSPALLRGSAAATLVEAAGRPDLLVVGRRSRRGALGSRLGPVAHAAVHHVHSPVAVVPHG